MVTPSPTGFDKFLPFSSPKKSKSPKSATLFLLSICEMFIREKEKIVLRIDVF